MKRNIAVLLTSGIAIAAVILAVAVAAQPKMAGNEKNGKKSNLQITNSNETGQTGSKLSFQNLTSDGSPVQGSPSAPITLVEFGDFQCEFCARFAKETEPQIYQNYVQPGKVNMVFKHLVHYGSMSDLAASASQCANDQGKFWDYHRILYPNQDSFMLSGDTTTALKNLASKIYGLDMHKFNSCLDGGTYKDIAKKDAQLASSLGFDNTPSFLIVKSNGSDPQKLVGAYPFGTFKALLDKAISEAET
jgi:protein-disulfide isomerase